jgi:hypothetical protein
MIATTAQIVAIIDDHLLDARNAWLARSVAEPVAPRLAERAVPLSASVDDARDGKKA